MQVGSSVYGLVMPKEYFKFEYSCFDKPLATWMISLEREEQLVIGKEVNEINALQNGGALAEQGEHSGHYRSYEFLDSPIEWRQQDQEVSGDIQQSAVLSVLRDSVTYGYLKSLS